jgi:hypothetical protein
MPLPSKVKEIGDAAEAAATAAGMKPASKPGIPAAEKPAIAVVPEPAKPGAQPKVDPDDYKERFSRYKTTTDQTIAELRQTLAQTQATLATVQGQNQNLMTKINVAPAADPDKLAADDKAKDDAAYKTWLGNLPQSIKDEYTEDYLHDQYIIQTSAASQQSQASPDNLQQLEQKVERVAQFQEKTEGQLYEEQMDAAFPDDGWITMTQGEAWAQFLSKTVSPVDQRTYGEIVKQGNESKVANTVIWVLQQYKKHQLTLDKTQNTTETVDPLANQLTPEGAGGGGADPLAEINANTESFTSTQVNEFFKDVATTKKYSAEEAAAIEKKIIAADAAGKIIPG